MTLNVSTSPRVRETAQTVLSPHGTEWIIDAAGCDADRLSSLPALVGLCDDIIDRARLHVVGEPLWHQFDGPGGFTGMYLLSESHLTCHTFPEFESAAFNLYCCRQRDACDWDSLLRTHLRAQRVSIRRIVRGPMDGGAE